MDDVSWAALTISLTVVGGLLTWLAYRRRGVATALKVAGVSLLPLAAYLTDTLQMFTRIVDAVADWATRLVLSPSVWIGIALAGVGVVVYGIGSALQARGIGTRGAPATREVGDGSPAAAPAAARGRREQLPPSGPARGSTAGTAGTGGDDDLADIEAILKKRGIT